MGVNEYVKVFNIIPCSVLLFKFIYLFKYGSKVNVYSCKIKLTNNISFFFAILILPDLEYLKQGFLETLSICVELEK